MASPSVVPTFVLRPQPQGLQVSRWVFGGISLAGLAAVSFFVTNRIFGQSDTASQQSKAAISSASPLGSPDDVSGPPRIRSGSRVHRGPETGNSLEAPAPESNSNAQNSQQPLMKRPITLHVERIEMSSALQAIAQQAGYKLELAPDMINPEIRLDYDGLSPESILADLGKRYGFTIFDEGNSQLLVIPAIDKVKGEGGFVGDPAQVPAQKTP